MATVSAALIAVYKEVGVKKRDYPWFTGHDSATEYGVPFQLTSFAVALLLVFRTNEVYRRWWDARRCVGRLCTCMRHVMRMGVCWFGDDPRQTALQKALAHWTCTLPFMMLFHVCEGHDVRAVLKDLVLCHQLEYLAKQKRPSFAVATCITHIITLANLSQVREQSMLSELTAAMTEFGHADDILKQPLPIAYTRHTSRFVLFWLMALPVSLVETYTWATIPITAGIAFFLLGIENIGVQIEEPFSVLPLDQLARECHADITGMISSVQACKDLAEPGLRLQTVHSQIIEHGVVAKIREHEASPAFSKQAPPVTNQTMCHDTMPEQIMQQMTSRLQV